MTTSEQGPVVQICQPEEVAAASKAYGLPVVTGDPNDPHHDTRCGGCGGEKTDDDCPYAVRINNYVNGLPWNLPGRQEAES